MKTERYHKVIIALALVICIAAVLSTERLEIITDAKQMLPQSNPYVQSFNRISEDFSSATLLLSVEGEERLEMIEAARFLADSIRKDPEAADMIEAVNLHLDKDFLYSWAMLIQNTEEREKTLKLLSEYTLTGFLRAFNDNLEDTYSGDEAEDEIDTSWEERELSTFFSSVARAVQGVEQSLEQPGTLSPEQSAEAFADLMLIGDSWNFDPRGEMLLFSVVPSFQIDDIDATVALMERIVEHISASEAQWPHLRFSYAGDVPQNYDEQIALGSDALIPSLVALLLITLLFLFSFRNIRTVMMALFALFVGILSTVLLVSWTIGSLNMLTSFFAVLLIGLGIDFGIHFVTSLDHFRSKGMGKAEAVASTYRSVGLSITLGALTTALAFFSLLLTESLAMKEFGFVAGCGVLLTLVSELLLLPALVFLFPQAREERRRLPLIGFGRLASLADLMQGKSRWCVITLAALLSALAVGQFQNVEFQYDMNELGPQKSVSVQSQRRIQKQFGLSPLPVMLSVDSLEEARRITEEVKELSSVAAVSSPADLIPPLSQQREALAEIEQVRIAPRTVETLNQGDLEDLLYEIQRLEWNMIEIGDLSVTAMGQGNMVQKQRDRIVREILGAEVGAPGMEVFQGLIETIKREQSLDGLNRFQSAFGDAIQKRARRLLSARRPMTLSDIPEELRSDMVSDDGKHFLIGVSPDESTATKAGLFAFRRAMDEIDPGFTGTVPIFVEWTRSISREIVSTTVSIAIIFIMLMLISFRSIAYTLIGSFSLLASALLMFGLFPLLGIQFNVTNIMVMPLIFGLGIAFQIHIIKRFIQEGSLSSALHHSGKGVLLSGLTTLIGFGSLALVGAMKAAQQLGLMLFVGIGINLLISFTLLPALLACIQNHKTTQKGVKR